MYMCDAHFYDFNNCYLCKHIQRALSLFSEVSQKQDNGQSKDISDGDLDIDLNFAESVFDPYKSM